jgi:hypothetical protein
VSGSRDEIQGQIALKMAAVADIAPPGHPAPIPRSVALPVHKRWFDEYVRAASRAAARAQTRWNGLIEGVIERGGVDRDRALREIQATSPAGPGEDSEFIAEIRRYWLKCVEANDDVPQDKRVPPEQFVLEWAANAGAFDIVDLIVQLTYFPVGLDQDGRWV